MRGKLFAACVSIMVLALGFGSPQAATLTIEDVCGSPGETVIVNVLLDNSADGAVAAAQMDINFNKSVFTVTGVAKTTRSSTIDLFMYSSTANGITFVVTGIGHSIAAGTGSIGEITVDIAAGAANGSYDWTLTNVILADPMGAEYSKTLENGTFDIPCGAEGAVLSLDCSQISSGMVYVLLDNSTVSEIAAGEMVITFDTTVFDVTAVAKTERTTAIDLFLYSENAEGINFVFTGIGHSIAPGTGPIAEISVDGTDQGDDWCIKDGSILADPLGGEIPHERECCSILGIEPTHVNLVPMQYTLSQNYPNPFNPTTSLDLSLPSSGLVNAVVYNVMGQKVRELVNSQLPAGYYTLTWDGLNEDGQAVTSGVYFLRVKTGTFSRSVKMLLLK